MGAAVEQALALADCDGCVRLGARVLVKPNLHGGEGYTSLEAIAGVVGWARRMGAGQVVVGDGPHYGISDARGYFDRIGLTGLCAEMGVTLVNFHESDYDTLSTNLPALPETIGITSWVRWADTVISVPVMKTHFNTLTTLAVKNLKGFLRPQDKRDIHRMDLHLAIAGLAKLLRPHIHLLDGSIGYEGMGPGNGRPVEMGVLVAGSSAFDTDVVGNWLMGFEPAKVRYLREAERLGCGSLPASEEQIAALTGCPLRYLRGLRREFEAPYEAAAGAYPNLTITAELACSGCLMNLFTALGELRSEGLGESLSGRVGIGAGVGEVDLAVGRCTSAVWDSCDHVAGCPPAIGRIKAALRSLLPPSP